LPSQWRECHPDLSAPSRFRTLKFRACCSCKSNPSNPRRPEPPPFGTRRRPPTDRTALPGPVAPSPRHSPERRRDEHTRLPQSAEILVVDPYFNFRRWRGNEVTRGQRGGERPPSQSSDNAAPLS